MGWTIAGGTRVHGTRSVHQYRSRLDRHYEGTKNSKRGGDGCDCYNAVYPTFRRRDVHCCSHSAEVRERGTDSAGAICGDKNRIGDAMITMAEKVSRPGEYTEVWRCPRRLPTCAMQRHGRSIYASINPLGTTWCGEWSSRAFGKLYFVGA